MENRKLAQIIGYLDYVFEAFLVAFWIALIGITIHALNKEGDDNPKIDWYKMIIGFLILVLVMQIYSVFGAFKLVKSTDITIPRIERLELVRVWETIFHSYSILLILTFVLFSQHTNYISYLVVSGIFFVRFVQVGFVSRYENELAHPRAPRPNRNRPSASADNEDETTPV